ncbi:MAG TPA: DUF4124 domain-containing protein [Gammaproteobacteria bacterium]|nr:DUF4124 domain-containing protein [Gammaproteobacteria bacterium]
MKTLAYLLLLALLALGLYAWFNPGFLRQVEETGRELSNSGSTTHRYYKWQDAAGQWQLSDRPPPAGVVYESVEVHRDQNVLPLPPQLREQ